MFSVISSQNELREEVIEKVKWQVNRDSAEDKLRDFLEWMYALKKDTLHHVSDVLFCCKYVTASLSVCRGDFTSTGPQDGWSSSRKSTAVNCAILV